MSSGRIFLAITLLLIFCIAGPVTAASIGTGWKELVPVEGGSFSGVMFSFNSSKVFAGGSQMYVRNWDDGKHWGGSPGNVATMSADGNYVVYGLGNVLTMLDKDGVKIWDRTMGGQVRALAISNNGSLVVSADNQGNINSWSKNGEFYGRNQTALVKQLAISPPGTLVVATTETGLLFMTKALDPVWSDTKNGSVDTDIIISNDGSTIITAGGRRVSSRTNTGTLNWMNDVTQEAIISMSCSYDCSVIVIGSQDKSIQAMDRYGKVHWTYPVGEWANSVAVSQDANIIVAAGIDRNLYVLDHSGKLLAKKKMDTIIHPRSLAVSADGRRIAVADEYALFGLTLTTEPDNIERVTLIPATSARYTDTRTPLPTTETTIIATPVTPVPVTTTLQSPLDPVTAIAAIGVGLSVVQGGRKD
ncbi:MAG: hypothetical protein Q8N94_07820 [Methanoregula sp.]|nr:hypothetical protein [Methanoregula sp.]